MRPTVRIRDPIHGTQKFTKRELAIIDTRAVQRLRGIKQLGMADLAYPGATHTRYAHALGVMHVAGRVFDTVTADHDLDPQDADRLLGTLRLAALFHDLGHAPLSHSTELLMPPVDRLPLGPWCVRPRKEDGHPRRATHEDYTLAIVLDSPLTEVIREQMGAVGVCPEDVAALLSDYPPPSLADRFVVAGRDWRPFLRQCVSSELDVDRMDYLLRDSYFAGVPYGRFDLEWLLENLRIAERDPPRPGAPRPVHLGIAARASFGFEDFLLSRFHMFLAVYLHHVPVGYELMLDALRRESPEEIALPADVEAYLDWDDFHFFHRLRASKSSWARRIVERRGFRLLFEHKQQGEEPDPLRRGRLPVEQIARRLREREVSFLTHEVKGKLSKYFGSAQAELEPSGTPHLPGLAPARDEEPAPTLFVVEDGRMVPLETHVALYRRYRGEVSLERIYVAPEQSDAAKAALSELTEDARRP